MIRLVTILVLAFLLSLANVYWKSFKYQKKVINNLEHYRLRFQKILRDNSNTDIEIDWIEVTKKGIFSYDIELFVNDKHLTAPYLFEILMYDILSRGEGDELYELINLSDSLYIYNEAYTVDGELKEDILERDYSFRVNSTTEVHSFKIPDKKDFKAYIDFPELPRSVQEKRDKVKKDRLSS